MGPRVGWVFEEGEVSGRGGVHATPWVGSYCTVGVLLCNSH